MALVLCALPRAARRERMNKMQEKELQKDGVYARKITITEDLADENGYATVLSIATAMQEAAGDQLVDLGIGFDVTSAKGLLWIVVWSAFQFSRFPKTGETVTFYTWPGKKMHWFYPRRAYVFDAEGKELAHAAYMWMLMDATKRSVTEDKGMLGPLPKVSVEGECKVPPMKIDFPADLKSHGHRTVDACEVDENNHLNNAHYLNWAADIAKASGFRMHELKTLWINYKKEILPEETVELLCERDGDTLYVAGAGTKEQHFIAKLDFA